MTGEQLLEQLEYLDADLIEEGNLEIRRRKRSHSKKMLTVLLIAALTAAFALVAAADNKNEWSIAILNYMGLSDADTTQLADGMVVINVSDEHRVKNELTGEMEDIIFTAKSSVGDQKNSYIHILTNIKVPLDYDEQNDYFSAEIWELSVKKKKNGTLLMHGAMLECMVEDGFLSLMMKISDTENLNTSYIELTLGNIYYNHDRGTKEVEKPEELFYSGCWNMSWKYSYQSNQRMETVHQTIRIGDVKYKVKSIVITPLEIKVKGTLAYKDRHFDADQLNISSLTLKDGTVISLKQSAGGHGMGTGWGMLPYCRLEVYETLEWYDVVLNPEEVVSVNVNGEEICLDANNI